MGRPNPTPLWIKSLVSMWLNPRNPVQPTIKSAEERCDEEREEVVRLAGIEPTTLGFGGQYSIH